MASLMTRETCSDKNSSRESEISIIHEWESLILDQCRRLFETTLTVTNRAQNSCCDAVRRRRQIVERRFSEEGRFPLKPPRCYRRAFSEEQLSSCSLLLHWGTTRKRNLGFVICWKGFKVEMRICGPVLTQWSSVSAHSCSCQMTRFETITFWRSTLENISESAKGIKVGYRRIELIACDSYVGGKWAWLEVMCLFRGSPGKATWSWSQDGDGVSGTGTLGERAWSEVYTRPWLRWRWGDGGV